MGPVEELSALVSTMEAKRFNVGLGAEVINELEDVFLAQLRFSSGALGSAVAGWAGRGERSGLDVSPVIYGTRGCIKGDVVIRDDGRRDPALDLFEGTAPPDLKERFFPGDVRDPFALELLDFTRACLTGSEMEATAAEGVLDLAMAYSVLESSTLGAPVRIDDVLSGAVESYQTEINAYYHL